MQEQVPNSPPDPLAKFYELYDTKQEILQTLPNVSALTADLYQQTLAVVEGQIDELEKDPVVIKGLRDIATSSLYDLASREDELRTFTAKFGSLVPQEDLEQRFKMLDEEADRSIADDLRLQIAIDSLAKTLRVSPGSATSNSVVSSDEMFPVGQVAEKKERPLPSITITQRGGGILIGKNGKGLQLSQRTQEKQKDYSDQRLRVLKVLIEDQGIMETPNEIWSKAFPDIEFDKSAFRQVSLWLNGVTFRRSPIVYHNGKRGPGSRYGIVDFNVEFRQEEITRPTTKLGEAALLGVVAQSSRNQVDRQEGSNVSEIGKTNLFPFSIYESVVLGQFIDLQKNTLKQGGITPIDPNVVEKMVDKFDPKERDEALLRYGEIKGVREAILVRLQEYFLDEDALLETLDKIKPNDPVYDLFMYLVEFADDERLGLLTELLRAERGLEYETKTFKRTGQVVLDVRRSSTVLPSVTTPKQPVVSLPQGQPENVVKTAEDSPRTTSTMQTRESAQVENVARNDDDEIVLSTSSGEGQVIEVNLSARQQRAAKEREWTQVLTHAVGEAIEMLEQKGLMADDATPLRRLSLLMDSAKFGTNTAFTRMQDARLLPASAQAETYLLSKRDRIVMYIFNSYQHDFRERLRQKKVLEVVDRCLAAYNSKQKD